MIFESELSALADIQIFCLIGTGRGDLESAALQLGFENQMEFPRILRFSVIWVDRGLVVFAVMPGIKTNSHAITPFSFQLASRNRTR